MEQMNLDSFIIKQNTDDIKMLSKSGTMKLTGDPFVDAGGLVMETLTQESVEDKIRYATDVYVDCWKGKMDTLFLHSKLNNTHVKNKPDIQRSGALEYYLGVLKDKGKISKGYCRVCSENGSLFEAGRNNYPLVGSGEFTNFHHFQENGLMICKNCLIKLYFMALAVFQSGGNLILLQFQSPEQKKLLQEDIIQKNMDKAARKTSDGFLKLKIKNPQNALFIFASRLIERFKLYDKPSQRVRLFCFTNFGSKPDVEVFDLPNPVFSFLKYVLEPDLKSDWMYFVNRHYIFAAAFEYNKESGKWTEKKSGQMVPEDEYQGNRSNRIYRSLLAGKSILRDLCKIHKEMKFNIHIAIAYLREVKKMQIEQIAMIRKLAEKIIALCQKEKGNYKKYIQSLNAKTAYELRWAVMRMVKVNYENGEEEPFVTSQEYIEFLFPDGQSWKEVRDFLMICLYEKLHELRVSPDQVFDEEGNEETDSNNNIF